ncbi:MAG: hypothetical protein Q4G05_03860 [Clostridia bacterium]|nr:hypothetical protein [Clostridia bacterium]
MIIFQYYKSNGGGRNSNTLELFFNRVDNSQIADIEEITVTVATVFPYTYVSSFKVTIINANLNIVGNPTNWTKDDVTLSIEKDGNMLNLNEYSFDNGTTWQNSNQKVYTENQNNIEILARDVNYGIIGPVRIDITRIDKTPPEIWIDNSTQNLIVTLKESHSVISNDMHVQDLQSGVASTGIVCYLGDSEITNASSITEVGRYNLEYRVEDEVGNVASLTRQVLVRWPTGGKYIIEKQRVSRI